MTDEDLAARHPRRRPRPASDRRRVPAVNAPAGARLDLRRRRRRSTTAAPATRPGRRSRRRSAAWRAATRLVLRLRHGRGRRGARPGRARAARSSRRAHAYNGTHRAARRPRGARAGSRVRAGRHRRHRRPVVDGLRRRRPAVARVAHQPARSRSPTSPALVRRRARARACYVVVDNTFATPLLQRPLELGADVVVHSVTKYLAGHSDVMLGAVVTAATDERPRRCASGCSRHRLLHGAIAGPMEAWLALRGLRTLHLRVERARPTPASSRAGWRSTRRSTRVRYPGFGAIVSIEVAGGAVAAERVAPRPGCGCTPPASAASSRSSSGGGGIGSRAGRPSRRGWCGCRSASRTSRTCGATSTRRCAPESRRWGLRPSRPRPCGPERAAPPRPAGRCVPRARPRPPAR